jgi:hypothetical protein
MMTRKRFGSMRLTGTRDLLQDSHSRTFSQLGRTTASRNYIGIPQEDGHTGEQSEVLMRIWRYRFTACGSES